MMLSLIIPCYNVENYILKCLNSIVSQNISITDYEIIVINDGSKDKSGSIAKAYCEKHPGNFRYFEQKNIGLSGTRNRGIKLAKGDYLWFVDSDDWIEENCLCSIINSLTNNCDVLAFSGFIPEGGRIENSSCFNIGVNSKSKLFHSGFADAAQLYIFRKEFLLENNLFFKEGIKHEDTLFTPIVLHKAENIVFFRTPVYHFLQREGSITTVVDIKRIYDLWDNMKILYDYSKAINDEVLKKGFHNHMAHHITEMLNYGIDNGKEGKKLIGHIMKQHPEFWGIMKNAIDLKPKIIYWLVRLSPLSFISTYNILAKLR